jgi:hypothetical protein
MEISFLGSKKILHIVECLLNRQPPCGIAELQLTNSSCPISPGFSPNFSWAFAYGHTFTLYYQSLLRMTYNMNMNIPLAYCGWSLNC